MLSNMSKMMFGLLLGAFIGVPLTSQVKADDTEVYFLNGGAIQTGKSQIMLMFEYSSAMNGGGRLTKVKEALENLAGNGVDTPTAEQQAILDSVDFGLAIFTKGPNGVIRYPIKSFNDTSVSPTFDTVVDELLNENTRPGNTPTIEGMSEAYRYFLKRQLNSSSYYVNGETHTDSYDGDKRYIGTSATSDCASNALILLAHGQINGNEWKNATRDIIPSGNRTDYCQGNTCQGTGMVKYMKEVNSVSTYTISPGSNGNNLRNLNAWADAGGTNSAIDWNSSAGCFDEGGLCTILLDIFEEVSSQGTSFVQAGVTVSQQNRLSHDNFLYFSQFQADEIKRWPGNLKKYKIEDATLVDQNGLNAVGDDGLFSETRDADSNITGGTSFWTDPTSPDGNQVEIGGTVSKLSQFLTTTDDANGLPIFTSYNRNLYTDDGTNELLVSDASVNATAFGMSDGEAFTDIKNRTLGFKLDTVTLQTNNGSDFDVPNVASSVRLMGDPLHSVPKVLQYSDGTSLAFVGTNLGYLHAFDISDGSEKWSYIPSDMLPSMQTYLLDENIGGDPELHNYGIDGEITLVHDDNNRNLKVDPGETALLFVGMRRGGQNYYVIDVSSTSAPDFKYKISNTDTGLDKLGMTWSKPVIANIDYGTGSKTVAIFGGGYDEDQDEYDTHYGNDDIGNDVVIYDIKNKRVLWNLQGSSLTTLKGQIGSVPANIRAVSSDNTPTVDHLYVVDTHGQLFRLDLKATSSSFEVGGRMLASLHDGRADGNRRFFYAPSVALIQRTNGQSYVAVAVGSGYRAHPLDEDIQDYFFMIKDKGVMNTTPTYDNFIDFANSPALTDVTANINEDAVPDSITADLATSQGWFIKLNGDFGSSSSNAGEKVLAEARILFDKIIFTTYIPTVDSSSGSSCSPVIGNGKLVGVNVDDGTSFFDPDTRHLELVSSGIPPLFQLLLTSDTDNRYLGCVGNECISGDLDDPESFISNLVEGFDKVTRVKWKKKSYNE